MPRFFTREIAGDQARITGEDVKHISQVLRMAPGDTLELCDGQGYDYQGEILELSREEVRLRLLSRCPSKSEPSLHFHLFQCIPKSDKMEWIIQKSVELGVGEITPVLSEFCVSRPDPKGAEKKGERYQKIALSAAKQSGRGKIPQVRTQIPFSQAAAQGKGLSCGLFFYEKGGLPLSRVVTAPPFPLPPGASIGLLVGSEGGFSEKEARVASEAGWIPVTLGPRILRCETAPLAALAALLFATGNME